VLELDDGSPAAAQAATVAARLAKALGARLQRQTVRAGSGLTLLAPADLLVLPRDLQAPLVTAPSRQTTLLVGPTA
jgi:hypothetical protein